MNPAELEEAGNKRVKVSKAAPKSRARGSGGDELWSMESQQQVRPPAGLCGRSKSVWLSWAAHEAAHRFDLGRFTLRDVSQDGARVVKISMRGSAGRSCLNRGSCLLAVEGMWRATSLSGGSCSLARRCIVQGDR